MPVDTSMYQAAVGPEKSLADYQQQYQGIAQNALNLQRSKQQLDAYTQDQAEKASLRNYLASSPDLSTAQGYNGLMAAAPTLGPGIHKTYQDSITSAALANKDNAQAGNFKAEAGLNSQKTTDAAFAHYQNVVGTLQTPEQAVNFTVAAYHDPVIGPILQAQNGGSLEDAIGRLQQATATPEGFKQWQAQASLGLGKLAEMTKVQNVNTGGKTVTQSVNPATGQVQTMGTLQNTVSPDTAANNATSRSNNAATIAAENLRAGVTPGGGLDANGELTAQAIAKGQLQPPQGMALLNPKNQRILGRVMEINPEYDSTTVTAKKAAATAFTSGTLGNQLRSFSTAGEHLDQLGTLIDALHNGDNQTLNKVGNAVTAWNGATPVTNFDSAKDVVAKEVMKAIVAGGGGQGEREELAKSLSSANSPQQLKGVVQQYRNLMSAQADNLMAQRRAAGLPDSTLPHYGHPSGATAPAAVPAAPSGFKITHVDGQPQ